MLTPVSDVRLKEGFIARALDVENELEALVELANICSRAESGVNEYIIDEMRSELTVPGFDSTTDTYAIFTEAGQLVAYIDTFEYANSVRVWCTWWVHPDFTEHELGSVLLHWAEERARQAVTRAPEGTRVVMGIAAESKNTAAKQLFEAHNFILTRAFLRMVIELEGAPSAPQFPENIVIRTAVRGIDERKVLEAHRSAFKDHWGYVEEPFEQHYERWIHEWTTSGSYDPDLWFLAMDGDTIAGYALCPPYASDDVDMGWVGSLGVLREYRRSGLGLALLLHAFNEFYQRGKKRVGLGVDASSLTGATRLYQRAGMRAVRQWDSYQKELRAGVDLSTHSLE